MKTSVGVRNIRRAANIVKRSATTPTFETDTVGKDLQKKGNDILLSTLRRYGEEFLDTASNGREFKDVMADIYKLAEMKWTLQKNIIVESLPKSYTKAADFIRNTFSLEAFYNQTVYVYTTRLIYREFNAALREYRTNSETPFGPYALVLNVVVSKWTALTAYQGKTYRGVNFTTDEYTVNTIFSWTAFTSSSENILQGCEFAHKALFVIDNSAVSNWRPKNVEGLSDYTHEQERLYPMSAMFKVTMVTLGACNKPELRVIHLSLQSEDDPDKANNGRKVRGGTAFAAVIAVIAVVVVYIIA
ncbi:hypothetical protein KP79_PYT22879 [Mizuhopecten yessoensis]|uniref:NAD(P)(+)--arginine ADP-ribosyltransferase n=1 Tax=Mizuhopecten yessoensis TaxID=6573 RepID=A0A210PTI5_MIZYE|nr:hypothetical protein KP79_PYT22879 [Mizuhopecten yessoensis]